MLINIDNVTKRPTSPHPILNLGFRVFFLGASVFAVMTMVLWLLILQGIAPFKGSVVVFYWHGHEMIFGYALAVIAGFLLTAVKTWTNQPMPYGYRLLWIFVLWAMARIIWLGLHATDNAFMLVFACFFDVLFWGFTSFAVIHAVYKAQQKRQIGIIILLLLLLFAHLSFYAGVFTDNVNIQKISLYFALYLVIGIVFVIARRVLPFFITKGVAVNQQGEPNGAMMEQKNSEFLDRLNVIAFMSFVIFDLFVKFPKVASFCALLCGVANVFRIKNWYHQGIWQKPLLWSLVIAFVGMNISLLFFVVYPFLSAALDIRSLGLHGLALFGIGLMTISMMARVSLGHTGRNIHQPPKSVMTMFILLILSGVLRIFIPMLGGEYMSWILMSQVFWIIAFGLFCVSYFGMLSKPRIDGLFG